MKARVLTALALITPVLAAIFLTTPWPLLGLGVAALWIAYPEANRLLKADRAPFPMLGTALLAWVALMLSGFMDLGPWVPPTLGICWLIGVLAALEAPRLPKAMLTMEFAGLWIAAPLAALLLLHGVTDARGTFRWDSPVLMSLLPLWAGDTAAIFVGRWIGKRPLAPSISPKKTVEGAAANLIACVAVAVGLGALLHIGWLSALACGLAAGILGQAGDLFESLLKRRANEKDSGTLLPGHGGLLDRIDSILFTAPAVLLILAFMPTGL